VPIPVEFGFIWVGSLLQGLALIPPTVMAIIKQEFQTTYNLSSRIKKQLCFYQQAKYLEDKYKRQVYNINTSLIN